MGNMDMDLGVATFNVNGIKAKNKRVKIFEWLKEKRETIIFLQETHSTPDIEKTWEKEWGGKIYFSHGRSNSTGVAILIKGKETEPVNIEKDHGGRRILVDLKINGIIIRLVNFYGPNKDETTFLENMFKLAYSNHITNNIIIAGDFNAVMDNTLDLSRSAKGEDRVHANKKVQLLLNALVTDCNLSDIFRTLNPDKRVFSHVNKKSLTQSRLDFFLIDRSLQTISECRYEHGINSDHSYVALTIKGEQIVRGRGYWKFNNSFLEDKEYVVQIKQIIRETHGSSYDSYRGLWDVIKFKTKNFSSRYGAKKKKEKNFEKNRLEGEISTIKETINKTHCITATENLYQELFNAEHLLNELLNKEMEGIIIRAKLQWVEQGEKSTRYFMGLEKSNQGKKSLIDIINDEGIPLRSQERIQKHTVKFYQTLFTSRSPRQADIDTYLDNTNMNTIPEDLSNQLEQEISLGELDVAVKGFKNNKSPGSDGLTAEFYTYFWGDIRDIIHNVFTEGIEEGSLSPSQRTGVITLLPKGEKDHRYLKHWRPITLLNVDYKLYVHVLKNRLKSTLPIIISNHQTGFQKGKSTTDNLILMYLVLEHYERNPQEEGYLVQIDYEKAFDSVEHAYLFSVLKKIGLGNKLIHMIKVAFSGCSSMILINGHLSEPVYLCRGLHQGSPLSPILFILAGQSLTDRCVQNEQIKGIIVDNVEVLMSLFADDTDTFLKDKEGIVELMKELELFGSVSGCKCNRDKTKCVPLGASKGKSTDAIRELLGQENITNTFSALGISFDNSNLRNVCTRNYEDKLVKANEWAVRWSRRYLTIYGKVTIIKTLLLSQFVYLIVPLVTPPVETLKRIQTDMYKFIWGGKPDKIKRAVINNNKSQGGIDMIDFQEFFTSLKLKLVGVIINSNCNPTWKQIVLSQLSNENVEIAVENNLVKTGCHFTQDLLAHYELFLNKAEITGGSLRNRCVWLSKTVTDIGRPIFNQYLLDYGLLYVTDFLGVNLEGEYFILNYIEFKSLKMGGMEIINPAVYLKLKMGLRRAYPGLSLNKIDKDMNVYTMLNTKGGAKGSGELRLKMQTKVEFEDIKPCRKWEAYFQSAIPWAQTFETLYQTTGINKLLEFQYKLVHRVATSRYMRKIMKIETTDLCHLCGISTETLEHQQLSCVGTRKFREKLEREISRAFPEEGEEQTELGLLTCIHSTKAVSFLRLVANYYINKKFHKQKLLWWEEYSAWVKKDIKLDPRLSSEEKHKIKSIVE